jgi:short-subunit dehydrogenase
MTIPSLRGQRALVTGASAGLGVAFARELAAAGAHVVITARRKDRLESLAEELRSKHGVEVDVIASDLGRPEAAKQLFDATEGAGKTIDVLINNAGFGTKQPFLEQSWEKTFEEMQLNLVSLTELSKRFGQKMVARKQGAILNVASVGAYLPTPSMATYGAGKSYVRNFTEGFAAEVSGTGVRVCCLCPGATTTEFASVAGLDLPWWKKLAFMSAERCASIGLHALFRGRRNIVSGWSNTFTMFLTRFLPRRLLGLAAERLL